MVSEKNEELGQSSEEEKQNPARDQRVSSEDPTISSELEVASIHTYQCNFRYAITLQ